MGHSGRKNRELLLVMADVVLLFLCAVVVIRIRYPFTLNEIRFSPVGKTLHLPEHVGVLLLYSAFIILFCSGRGLYGSVQMMRMTSEALALANAVCMSTLLVSTTIYLGLVHRYVSRLVVGMMVVLSTVVLFGWRLGRRKWMEAQVAAGLECRNVLIVGAGEVGAALERFLAANRQLGYVVRGFIDDEPVAESDNSRTILGSSDDLADVVRRYFVDEIITTVCANRDLVKRIASQANDLGIDVRVLPDLYDGLAWGVPVEYVGLFPTFFVHKRNIPAVALTLKRIVDVVAAATLLILLLPVFFAVALAIKFESPGPVFYRSPRIGKKGRTFTCYKFRSMCRQADQMLGGLQHLNEREGLLFKISNDPRITYVGRILRKYSIDEFPQLWNVLIGDMSLVGPRPPVPGEYEQYQLEHLKRLDVLPGMTGLWQVEARQDPSFDSYVNLDTQYIEHWTLWLDAKILFRTVFVVLAGTGR